MHIFPEVVWMVGRCVVCNPPLMVSVEKFTARGLLRSLSCPPLVQTPLTVCVDFSMKGG